MTYIGIDPGKSGALAIIDGENARVIPFDEQEYIEILNILAIDHSLSVVCLEDVHSMPGQGVKSTFNFGENFGWIQGVLCAMRIPYQLVSPKKWKGEFSLTSDKKGSIACCKRLFPGASLLRTDKCKSEDDGMAEALLMAEYARRHFGRE